jgi:hypothetical protein
MYVAVFYNFYSMICVLLSIYLYKPQKYPVGLNGEEIKI